jgi:hypothetical protein
MNTISENEVYQTQFLEEVTMKFVENAGKMTKWSIGCSLESSLPLHAQIFINHRRSATPQIIMPIFASFVKVSHPSTYY